MKLSVIKWFKYYNYIYKLIKKSNYEYLFKIKINFIYNDHMFLY